MYDVLSLHDLIDVSRCLSVQQLKDLRNSPKNINVQTQETIFVLLLVNRMVETQGMLLPN